MKIFVFILLVLIFLAAWIGVNCVIALLATWVCYGFGLEIPFWPTLGSVFLLQLLLGWIGSAARK